MFRMIRCGTGFDPVIMVSPPDAGPETADAKFYRYASWRIDNFEPGVFHEIRRDLAISYFSGVADGIGCELPFEGTFPTLESALEFINKKRNESIIKNHFGRI